MNGSSTNKRYIVEATGSGVAILDYDHDGWPDLFLVNGSDLASPQLSAGKQKTQTAPTSHLYRNNHDGTFADVTGPAGLGATAWGQGACVGDYDNDGYDDLFVTAYGTNRLYHNERNGTFREVAEQAGVSGSGKEWGTGCAFIDYDRDGKLDLVVANYVHFNLEKTPVPGQDGGCIWKGSPVMCGPRGLESAPNLLFHNEGGGRFSDVSVPSGISKTAGTTASRSQPWTTTKMAGPISMWPVIRRHPSSITTITTAPLPTRRQRPALPSTKTVVSKPAWARAPPTTTVTGTSISSRQISQTIPRRSITRTATAPTQT